MTIKQQIKRQKGIINTCYAEMSLMLSMCKHGDDINVRFPKYQPLKQKRIAAMAQLHKLLNLKPIRYDHKHI